MVFQFAKKLHSQQPIQGHKEQEEQRDIVDLLAGSFEYLIDPTFWHRKFEEDSKEANHYQGSWCPQDREIVKLG